MPNGLFDLGLGSDLPPEGLCGDEADLAILYGEGATQVCGSQCWADADPGTCVAACLFDLGVTEACASCIAVLMPCLYDHCIAECVGSPEPCDACVAQWCPIHSLACFGGPESVDP